MAEPSRPLSVIDTLELAKREFVFIGGCTVTDRPDVPLSPETSWIPDLSGVIAAIDDAIDQLVGPSAVAEQPKVPERHSGCLFSGPERPSAPISVLSNEGRCTRCISTICGRALCR